MLADARAVVPAVTAQEAATMLGRDDVLFIDVRDGVEVALSGKVKGAVNVSRGMLEFRADATSPYYDTRFSPAKTIVVYCASGGRSALSGLTLKQMGYDKVYNLGGFKDWKDGGGAIEFG
jgi:rhodanese-related sulfurtransferase